ncbi:MAG: hypothetical protein CM15mP74_10910 [Halieaceae bacterium]|nr:MAG: hypothetical protein CM15mP74_10910 [Halieaceae bacterium]
MTHTFNDEHAISVVKSIAQFGNPPGFLTTRTPRTQPSPQTSRIPKATSTACVWFEEADIGERMGNGTSFWATRRGLGDLWQKFISLWGASPGASTPLSLARPGPGCAKRAIGGHKTGRKIMGPWVYAVKLNDHFFLGDQKTTGQAPGGNRFSPFFGNERGRRVWVYRAFTLSFNTIPFFISVASASITGYPIALRIKLGLRFSEKARRFFFSAAKDFVCFSRLLNCMGNIGH